MKPIKAVKSIASKKNPFSAAPAAPKAVTKPVTETKPARSSAPVEKIKAAPAPAAEARPIAKASRSATIEAKIDVGFGNTLYLRGEGKGLNWNQGIPLTNVDGCTWQWSGEADEKLKVKLLLNDAVWAQGEDLVVRPGEKVQIAPAF